jgi:hypothetical protein
MASNEDEGANGTPHAYPLVAYETFVPHGVLCGLIAHYLESPAKLLAGEHVSLSLIMRPEMARDLAAALTRAAEEAESRPQPKETH